MNNVGLESILRAVLLATVCCRFDPKSSQRTDSLYIISEEGKSEAKNKIYLIRGVCNMPRKLSFG